MLCATVAAPAQITRQEPCGQEGRAEVVERGKGKGGQTGLWQPSLPLLPLSVTDTRAQGPWILQQTTPPSYITQKSSDQLAVWLAR